MSCLTVREFRKIPGDVDLYNPHKISNCCYVIRSARAKNIDMNMVQFIHHSHSGRGIEDSQISLFTTYDDAVSYIIDELAGAITQNIISPYMDAATHHIANKILLENIEISIKNFSKSSREKIFNLGKIKDRVRSSLKIKVENKHEKIQEILASGKKYSGFEKYLPDSYYSQSELRPT